MRVSARCSFSPGTGRTSRSAATRARACPARRGPGGQEVREDVTILRDVRSFTVGGTRLTVVASALLSADLRKNARKLTESLTLFTALDQFRVLFRLVLVGFFFLFSLPIFFITILVSLLLTERIIGPIVHLEDATRRVAEGDFSFRILTRPRDELANLVDSFNGMISELERSRRKLLQAERITAWQEIAQRLAHEIRNPLTPIKLSAQRILKTTRGRGRGLCEGPASRRLLHHHRGGEPGKDAARVRGVRKAALFPGRRMSSSRRCSRRLPPCMRTFPPG